MNINRITASCFSLLLASSMIASDQTTMRFVSAELTNGRAVPPTGMVSQSTKGKKIKVRGTIKDESGEPIIGATVRIKGQSDGTISDLDGNFTIDVNSGNSLQVSYIGYQSQDILIDRQQHISVVLEEDRKTLNEVVVIGYGTQKKGDITSSVGSVKSEDFTAGAINDAGQLIQGKIAGLSVTNPNGNPVGGTEISLRGNTTILGASTNPLILIDGVPGFML